ncbi:MAG: glycosyltransferase family A protein [Thermoanaerobaculia bacterium]
MSTRKDLVSIGMPVYNGELYLEAAIRSNLDQTYSNLELIIADNASTDRTEEIGRSFAAADSRVTYHRHERNIGAAKNYNRLHELSKGEYFRWSNADDLVKPQLIERTLPILRSRSDVVIAYGRTQLIDANGKMLENYDDNLDIQDNDTCRRYSEFYRRVGLTNIIYGLMRSSAMKETQLMGDGQLPASDISFMASMILRGKFVEVPEQLFFRRMHEGAFSAMTTPTDQQQFWRASGTAVALPHCRAALTDLKAIVSSPLPLREKLALSAFSAKRLHWHRRILATDFLNLLSARSKPK